MNDPPAEVWLYRVLERYGLRASSITRKQGYAMLRSLERGEAIEAVAKRAELRHWSRVYPSDKQLGLLRWKVGEQWVEAAMTPRLCSLMIDAKLKPLKCYKDLVRRLDRAKVASELDAVGRDIGLLRNLLPEQHFNALVEAGKEKRLEVGSDTEIPE